MAKMEKPMNVFPIENGETAVSQLKDHAPSGRIYPKSRSISQDSKSFDHFRV